MKHLIFCLVFIFSSLLSIEAATPQAADSLQSGQNIAAEKQKTAPALIDASAVIPKAYALLSGDSAVPTPVSRATLPQTKPLDYTINIVWTNKALDKEQSFVIPNGALSDFDNVFKWSELNATGECRVVIWYDSLTTSEKSVENTRRFVKDKLLGHTKSDKEMAPIVLKDLREIPLIRDNADVFSTAVPVYLRTDLQRVIAATYTLEKKETGNFVFANLNMPAISRDALFDAKTLEKLEEYGTVMGRNKRIRQAYGYENSFFILRGKLETLEATNGLIVNLGISLIKKALETLSTAHRFEKFQVSPQEIYNFYPDMFAYLNYRLGLGELRFDVDWWVEDEDRNNLIDWVTRTKIGHCGESLRLIYFIPSENYRNLFYKDSSRIIPETKTLENQPRPSLTYEDATFRGNAPHRYAQPQMVEQ